MTQVKRRPEARKKLHKLRDKMNNLASHDPAFVSNNEYDFAVVANLILENPNIEDLAIDRLLAVFTSLEKLIDKQEKT